MLFQLLKLRKNRRKKLVKQFGETIWWIRYKSKFNLLILSENNLEYCKIFVSSSGSTETKYIKLKPKLLLVFFKFSTHFLLFLPSVVNINILAGFCNCITCLWLTHSRLLAHNIHEQGGIIIIVVVTGRSDDLPKCRKTVVTPPH